MEHVVAPAVAITIGALQLSYLELIRVIINKLELRG
jgi:hypothetical protein